VAGEAGLHHGFRDLGVGGAVSLGVEYSANVGTENSLAGAPGHRFGARP
jgi:hypothetical protein